MSKPTYSILIMGTASHHSVQRYEFVGKRIINKGDDVFQAKMELLAEAIEDFDQHVLSGANFEEVKKQFHHFFETGEPIELALELPYEDEDEDEDDEDGECEGSEYLFYAKKSDGGSENLIFVQGDELDKYENHWFHYRMIPSEKIEEMYDELNQKSKDELIHEIILKQAY